MALEVSVQQSIMQAIQQLEEVTGNTGRSGGPSLDMDIRMITLIADLKVAVEAKESLAQHCHELETKVQCLDVEKQALMADNTRLMTQVEKRDIPENFRSPDNRRQIDLLKEELFKMETTRDDYRVKIHEQDKQISTLQEKVAELQLAADVASQLKDEVDALSEKADKVQVLETTITSYKKRLEDYTDIKKQLKVLDDKNEEFYQQNLKYEEELKNNGVWKSQCDVYKMQAAELQLKLDEETQRADRISFQVKTLESKYSTVLSEKERLAQERDLLVDENEELKVGKVSVKETDVARELAPTELKERLNFLQKENNSLRVTAREAAAKQALLDDATARIDKLIDQNRAVNQRVLELESQIQESQKLRDDHSVSQLETTIKEYRQKVNTLQEVLTGKESELQNCQARYTRNLEKAREVAQNLERKPNDIDLLRQTTNMKEMEEQLLTVAFYRLSLLRHREAFDDRLAMLSASQGQSFLARQRQATPRKPLQSFKSK